MTIFHQRGLKNCREIKCTVVYVKSSQMGIMSVLGGNHVVCWGGNILIQSGASTQCGTQYQIDGWNMGYLQLNAETSIREI